MVEWWWPGMDTSILYPVSEHVLTRDLESLSIRQHVDRRPPLAIAVVLPAQ